MDGTIEVANASEREAGIGFWITSGRDRVGYAPLASYAPGLAGGSTVTAGRHLGQHAGPVLILAPHRVPGAELSGLNAASHQRPCSDRR